MVTHNPRLRGGRYPRLGEIVHYITPDKGILAAIVTESCLGFPLDAEGNENYVSLWVFRSPRCSPQSADAFEHERVSVPFYDPIYRQPNTWHWMPRD